jgi:uncharacterized membrane protein YheB (UPF0754 family)
MLQNLAINGLAGAVTGYITNNIAIKMLFKSYFGLGGVIEKEYKEFIENISKLIEKDLINHQTLQPELQKEEFREVVEEIIKTIFILELPKIWQNKRIADIKGIDKTLDNIVDFIEEDKKVLIKDITALYTDKPLNYYISKEQFDFIVDKASTLFIQKQDEVEAILFESIKDKKIENLFSTNFFYKLNRNIKELIDRVDFREFDADFNRGYNDFLDLIELEEILDSASKQLNEMKLKEFINDSSNLSFELINRFLQTFKTPQGQKLLELLAKNILDLIKDVDLTLEELLGAKTSNNIIRFIEREFPRIIDKIIVEVENDKEKIESLIMDSIDNYLQGSIVGQIFKIVKDQFFADFLSREGVVLEIVKLIRENREEAPKILTKKLLDYLESHTIGEIVVDLENKQLLSDKILAKIIKQNIETINAKKIDIIEEFLDKKVEDIYRVDLTFLKEQMPILFSQLKENYFYKEKFKEDISKEIVVSIDKLKKKRVEDLIDRVDLEIDISSYIDDKMLEKKVKEYIEFDIDFDIKNLIDKNKKLLNFITSIDETHYKTLSKMAVDTIQNNLPQLLEGRVSVAVSKELYRYQPSQIRDMVEEFMGKELAPINIFGAGLGAVAGAGYSALATSFGGASWKLATPLVFGVTGVLTNWLAIKMLFKPYEKKWYLPFISPGIVAKKKADFAKNISNFVKKDILTDESIENLYSSNRELLKEMLEELISKDNFDLIDRVLKKENEKISEFVIDKMFEYIENNSDKIAKKLVRIIEDKKDILIQKSPIIAKSIFTEILKRDFSDEIAEYLKSYLNSKNLSFLTPIIMKEVQKNQDVVFSKLIDSLDFKNIKKTLYLFEDKYQEFIKGNSLDKFIKREYLSNILSSKLIEFVRSDKFIDSILDKITQNYIDPHTPISRLFNGKIKTFVYRNVDFLIENILEKADNYRDTLKSSLRDKANSKFGVMANFIPQSAIDDIVDSVFDEALPKYINQKREFIYELVDDLLSYRLDEIGVDINKDITKKKIQTLLENDRFVVVVEKVADSGVKSILSLNIETLLVILNIRNFRQLIDIFSPILENTLFTIQTKLSQEKVSEILNRFIEPILDDIARKEKAINLINGIDLSEELKVVINRVKKDKNFSKFELFIEEFLEQFFATEFYNKSILEDDLKRVILNSDKAKIKEILKPFLKEFIISLNSLIEFESKKDILEDFTKAGFKGVEVNINELIKSIDIQKIIQNEINGMHPKEIEEMFNSFAKSYFNKLTLYGVGGAVFGLPQIFL